MASKEVMAGHRIKRIQSGKQFETRSRMARNRKRNYAKEIANGETSSNNS